MQGQMMMKQKDHYRAYNAGFYRVYIVLIHVQMMMKQEDHYMVYSAAFY